MTVEQYAANRNGYKVKSSAKGWKWYDFPRTVATDITMGVNWKTGYHKC